MDILSGHDEFFILVILQLESNAYGVTIRQEVSRATGKDWSIGAVYDHLYRLEKKGLIESTLSHPVRERGGRSKRMFRVRKEGLAALVAHRRIREKLWKKIGLSILESG